MQNIEKIAEELFNKIRSRFDPLTIGDEKGKTTDDPRLARFYNFDFRSSDNVDHGPITISIVDGKSLKVTFGKNMLDTFEPQHRDEWENLLRNLRKFSKRNMIQFDVRDISRSNLTQRDINQTVASTGPYKSIDSPVTEGVQWYGTTRTSIQDFGPTRLIIHHRDRVDQERPGARSRGIASMFVETDNGERFRMPYNRLSLGRAMAQHLSHGGKIYDKAGTHIAGMAEEMSNLAFFVRNTRRRTFEDQETTAMVRAAMSRYQQLGSDLTSMGGPRGYQRFAESFSPDFAVQEDYDIDELKERFVKRMFDDRLSAALPYVYRAYQQQQTIQNNLLVKEFGHWADQITNEQNAASGIDLEKLSDLLSEPLVAGIEGLDAVAALSGLIDNDNLFDQVRQAAVLQGDQADMRPVVDQWFERNLDGYTSLMPSQNLSADNSSIKPESGSLSTSPRNESLDFLRRLAGL